MRPAARKSRLLRPSMNTGTTVAPVRMARSAAVCRHTASRIRPSGVSSCATSPAGNIPRHPPRSSHLIADRSATPLRRTAVDVAAEHIDR